MTLGIWTFRSESKAMAPEPTDAVVAQDWLNFALLRTTYIPDGCTLKEPGILRKESPPTEEREAKGRAEWTPANTCSYIWNVSGGKRSLRLKQFLYDWGPPAADHPCLWEKPDRLFQIDDWRIGWFGTDFKGKVGASAILWGTLCEVRVEKGEFTDDEIIKFYQGLKPVSILSATIILETPFASLSYWARNKCKLVGSPISLWRYRRLDPEAPYNWATSLAELKLSKLVSPVPGSGWQLDSVCAYGDGKKPFEVEWLFKLGTRDRYLFVRMLPFAEEDAAISIPPKTAGHPCKSESRMIGGHRVWHAWIDDRFGPHDAVYNTDDNVVLIQTNSCVDNDIASFQRLLEKLL